MLLIATWDRRLCSLKGLVVFESNCFLCSFSRSLHRFIRVCGFCLVFERYRFWKVSWFSSSMPTKPLGYFFFSHFGQPTPLESKPHWKIEISHLQDMVLSNNGGDDFSRLTPEEEAQDPESPQPKLTWATFKTPRPSFVLCSKGSLYWLIIIPT